MPYSDKKDGVDKDADAVDVVSLKINYGVNVKLTEFDNLLSLQQYLLPHVVRCITTLSGVHLPIYQVKYSYPSTCVLGFFLLPLEGSR